LGVTITFWHCTKVIGVIFDLETNINHAGFAVHHNFSPSWDFFENQGGRTFEKET